MTFGALAFLNPLILVGLIALPIIYWLLRTVPPSPKRVTFPPTRILVGLENTEKTPANSPWWLTLLRLLAAALVIFALANPLLNPTRKASLSGDGPVVVFVDNGWASAAHWDTRAAMLERIANTAESQNKPLMVVPTASPTRQYQIKIEAPTEARATLSAIIAQPFPPNPKAAVDAAAQALASARPGKTDANVIWLSDGIGYDTTSAFAERLSQLSATGTLQVIESAPGETALGLAAGLGRGGQLTAKVIRASGTTRTGVLHALSARNERLGETTFEFKGNAQTAETQFDLPLELRNQVARILIAGENSAGAMSLLDARSQRQRIALFSGQNLEQAQPLLAPLYYVDKAVRPFSEIMPAPDKNLMAGVEQAIEKNASILVFADIGRIPDRLQKSLEQWVDRGGVLLRFSGPRLERSNDALLPAPLRAGGRTLGGALSWSTPQALATFSETSPFVGLAIPEDVVVKRQVLVDPTRLPSNTQIWARLEDGTPLVTAKKQGEGRIILFHVTANSDWSNLPISGLFVEMLQRISALGNITSAQPQSGKGLPSTAAATAQTDQDETVLSPLQTLNGFGILRTPPPTAQALTISEFVRAKPSLTHPPGYYGSGNRPRALNVLNAKSTLAPLPALPSRAQRQGYKSETSTPLRPWFFAIAFGLIILDMIAVLLLQAGGLGALRSARTNPGTTPANLFLPVAISAALAIGAMAMSAQPVVAQSANQTPTAQSETDIVKALKATREVTLGYVLTGDLQTDETSLKGLKGLGTVLDLRTAISTGDPIGVDIVKDQVAFYPILYWPILKNAQPLPEATLTKIDAYMKGGGMIIFDTRDHGEGLPVGMAIEGSGTSALRRLLGRLDLPRLEPVPVGHVLTKAFYLLQSFPGRWDGGQLWAEASAVQSANGGEVREARRADGVTSILITPNDFASAWALDRRGLPLYPVTPGGEPQREMAFRTGINIVMHALTGNYKADQVHVPALLERFGQ